MARHFCFIWFLRPFVLQMSIWYLFSKRVLVNKPSTSCRNDLRAEVTGFESSGNIPQLNMKREIQCSVEGQIAPSLRLRILCIAAKQRTSFDGRNSLSCKRGLVGQMFACALLHTAIRTVGRKSCAELRPLLTFWANKNDGHDDQWCQCSQIVQLAWGDKTMHLTTVVAHKKKQSHGAVFGSLEYDKLNKRWKRAPFQGLATHNIKRPT